MSADPVTMFIISAGKALFDIKESKKQSKIEQQRYQDRIQRIAEVARREEEDRIDALKIAQAHNLAIQAGSGWNIDSSSFLNIQDQQYIKAEKDITTIRLNLASDVNQLSLASQMAKSQRRTEQFGSWASIAGGAVEAKAKKDAYEVS
jgi:hypothetical protein